MGVHLSELLNQMNERGLTFRRTESGELEISGDLSRLTDAIRNAISEHRQAILACLPAAAPAAPATWPPMTAAMSNANAIRKQLCEFGLWLGRFAAWAQPRYLDGIDRRLSEAVDTQDPLTVARQIAALQEEVDGINWAAEILPIAFETEAKHAVAAGAGPAIDDEAPF